MSDLDVLRRAPPRIVVRSWSTHGGTERYCVGLVRWLGRRGVRPTVWCHAVDHPSEGVELRRLPIRGRGRVGRLLGSAVSVARLPPSSGVSLGLLRAPGFDLLRAGGGAHGAAMARLGRHGVADQIERRVDRWALRTARRVVANSQLARADICAEVGRSEQDVVCVRNGVDLERFRPAESPPEGLVVAFVGHGFARKGLATALRALVHLPGVELRVVGRDRRQGVYVRLARSLGVLGRVRFLGAVDDLPPVLRRCRALVLPTRYDPSANVVLEAMACGLPVVTTRHDGAAEVLPMPWLVVDDPDDDVGIADALRRSLAEPEAGPRCRRAAEAWSHDASYAALAAEMCRVAEVG